MGLKDQQDGTGHILGLELGLEYLHVDGTQKDTRAAPTGAMEEVGVGALCTTTNSNLSCINFSDSDDDSLRPSSTCLGPTVRASESPKPSPSSDTMADSRSKVDFALKLGYSEELVLLVLQKLGPGALINDVLGELVKLGTKSEPQNPGGAFTIAAPSPSPLSLLDSCRSLCPSQWPEDKENLRPVVVDGSNVAMSHGNKEVFSCQGIQLAVDWFLERGHRDITVFVPAWRKEQSRPDALISEQEILRRLEKQKILVFTPSRRVQGRRVVCYDDRFIVKLAFESDGIIVSNDNYRDLANEKPEWKKFIDERLLMYSFVNDKFMPPDDPLGRHGPSLENFLRKRPMITEHRRQPCPYGKKCTYGHKCKFYHPERGSQPQRAVADELRASVKISSTSRGLMEDALTVTSQSLFEVEDTEQCEHWQSTPKKHSNPSLQSSLTDLCEDKRKVQSRRGSSSSSSSGCSSFLGYTALGGPPSPGSLDRWDYMASSSSCSGAIKASGEHRCESPEGGYSSLVKAYSGLSLEFPESPENFSTIPDLKSESLLSDCSSDGSSNIFSPELVMDNGSKFHHLHQPYPFHSMNSASRHGFTQQSSQIIAQDIVKQCTLETNFTLEESTSFQTSSVEHNHCNLQGRSLDLAKREYGSSFRDQPSSHRSLLSIARGPEHSPQGYHTGLPKHCYPLGNSFEDIPSSINSPTNRICHTNNPVPNRQSPQSPYQGLPKQHGCQTGFSFEESTSSPMSFSSFAGLHQHSPQAYPLALLRQHFECFEEPLPSLDCHASHNRIEFNELSSPGYPSGGPKSHDYSFASPPSSVTVHTPQHSLMPRSNGNTSPKGFSPSMSTLHSHQGNNVMLHSPWKKRCNRDYERYDTTPSNTKSTSPQAPQMNWIRHGQKCDRPSDLVTKNLPDTSVKTWNSPWGRYSYLQVPSKLPTSNSPSGLHLHQENPAFNRYQDVREKLFINLCGIFPPDVVQLVMARNPHMMDAQELAAAILLTKSQCGT